MTPVEPKALHEGGMLMVFAKDQPEYFPLPASVDHEGTVMTEWELTAEELASVLRGGRIRLWLSHTQVEQGRPLTPITLEVVED